MVLDSLELLTSPWGDVSGLYLWNDKKVMASLYRIEWRKDITIPGITEGEFLVFQLLQKLAYEALQGSFSLSLWRASISQGLEKIGILNVSLYKPDGTPAGKSDLLNAIGSAGKPVRFTGLLHNKWEQITT